MLKINPGIVHHQTINQFSIKESKAAQDGVARKQIKNSENRFGKFSKHLEEIIASNSKKHGISQSLIKAIIRAESGGMEKARSPKGALGLMQLMPKTARELGVNPLNPDQNVDGGVRFLKSMAQQFGDLDTTLAAYNAGPGAVRKYKGVPPFEETRQYIKRIRTLLNYR